MKYALSLAFLVLCVPSPAHACFACPTCSMCVNVGNTSAWSSCFVACTPGCKQPTDCFIIASQKTPSGEVQVSCAGPAAIYPPIQPLAAAELPGTIGIDVRVLSTNEVLIDRVLHGSPAYLAGLHKGDHVKSINETRAGSVPYSRIIKTQPGNSVRLTVTRNGKAFTYDMVAVRLDLLSVDKQKPESAQIVQIGLNKYPHLSQ